MSEQNIKKPENNGYVPKDNPSVGEKNTDTSDQSGPRFSWSAIHNLIEVLTLIVITITLIINSCSISEMRKDRNQSYQPVITMNPVRESVQVSHDYFTINFSIDKMPKPYVTGFVTAPSLSSVTDSSQIIPCKENITYFGNTQLVFVNVGPGNANKVSLSWDEKNVETLYNQLIESNEEVANFTRFNEYLFSYDPGNYYKQKQKKLDWTSHYAFPLPESSCLLSTTVGVRKFNYMLGDCKETYTTYFPVIYTLLFSEILLNNREAEPTVKLKAEFSDVQGIDYYEYITLSASSSNLRSFKVGESALFDRYGLTYTISADFGAPIRK